MRITWCNTKEGIFSLILTSGAVLTWKEKCTFFGQNWRNQLGWCSLKYFKTMFKINISQFCWRIWKMRCLSMDFFCQRWRLELELHLIGHSAEPPRATSHPTWHDGSHVIVHWSYAAITSASWRFCVFLIKANILVLMLMLALVFM